MPHITNIYYHIWISIPQWSDFNKNIHNMSIITCAKFQSHNGLILIEIELLNKLDLLFISIPQWSDFNPLTAYDL